MVNIAVSCIKYVIFAFTFLCFIIGISLLGIGIYGLVANFPFGLQQVQTILSLLAVPYICIGIGLVISLIAFLGCCGAIVESTCMLLSFSIIMLILLVAQIGGGLYGMINYDLLLEKGLNEMLYATKDHNDLLKTWDQLQYDFGCCGINQPSDWEPIVGHNQPLPMSCCNFISQFEKTCTVEAAIKVGCKQKLAQHVKSYFLVSIALAITVSVLVEFITILFTCTMFYAYRKQNRQMHQRNRANAQPVVHPTTSVYPKQ